MGRRVSTPATANISVGFVYDAVYYSARAEFEQAFAQAGDEVTGISAREELILWRKNEIVIQRSAARDIIAEGWTLSVHHRFSPADPSTLHKGDGGILKNNVSIIDTIAGDGTQGFSGDNGEADKAQLYFPRGVAVDAAGNVYVADRDNNRIRKVDTNGIITTVAGNGQYGYTGDGGPATEARLNFPTGVAVDGSGNLYIADGWNHCIRKVDTNGIITTVAGDGQNGYTGDGGPATQARLYLPNNVTVDTSGNIYIADTQNQCVRKVDPNGIITTVAGGPANYYLGDGGPAIEASLKGPGDVVVDSSGNLYIADFDNHRIRKVDTSGIISTIAGSGVPGYTGDGGPATQAQLVHPIGVDVDAAGNIYIADLDNYRIRKVDTNGIITTMAGTEVPGYSGDGGPATEAQLNKPWSVAICASGNLYIPDRSNQRIRKVGPPSALAGVAIGGDVAFAEEQGLGHILASSGRHKQTIDLDTAVVLYEFGYDEENRLVSITDRFGNQSTINRDSNGVPTSITSPDGITTTLTVDENYHLTRITYPDSSYYRFEYAPDGLLTAKIEPESNRFEHVFDSIGRLTDATDQEGGHYHYSRFTYANGDIFTQLTTGEGNLITYLDNTDSTGAYTSTITDATGAQTLFARSADGLTVNKSLPCGMDLDFHYGLDAEYKFEYVKEMTESTPAGLEKITSRDKTYEDTDADEVPDLITETVTVNGKATTLVTDTLQATKTITSPEGRNVTTFYDPNSLLTTSLSIPGLYDTAYGYDTTGRLTSITTNTRQTTFTYDAQGFLESITDPENHTTTYFYDALGRMTGISRPDTSSVGFTYDKNGNMTVLTNPANIPHGFGYNLVNLNGSYTTPLSGSYTYVYDRDRRLVQVNFPSGKQISNIYGNGRLEQIQTPEGNVYLTYLCGSKVDAITKGTEEISYGYDGSLVTLESLSGTLNESLSYGYNTDFNLTGFTYAGGTVNYTYDNDGLLTGAGGFTIGRNAVNGLPESVTGGALNLSRTFNGYGEVAGQDFTVASQAVTSWTLTRDNAGRITNKTETVDGVTTSYTYTYDPMGRLLTVTKDGNPIEEYQYDSVGTRTYEMNSLRGIAGRTFAYDDEDHLLTAGDAAYQYDLDGYLTTRTVGAEAPYEVTSYSYSSRGELLSVTLPDGTAIEYIHDPLGRRIAKKVDGTITEKYLWQGLTRLLAVYDGNDLLLARFLYADGRMPVAMDKGGATYYLTYDQVGSLRAVADAVGNVVKRIDYDSFGNIINDTNPSFEIPFGFAGGLHDRDTGLVRFGFRDYDPDLGRWTAKDPIGFWGGDVDLYGYCLNDPVNWIDPLGLLNLGDVEGVIVTIGLKTAELGGLISTTAFNVLGGAATVAGIVLFPSELNADEEWDLHRMRILDPQIEGIDRELEEAGTIMEPMLEKFHINEDQFTACAVK
jgi:RHS repeat-associated protein